MKRISTYMPNDDYQYRMRMQEWKMGDSTGKNSRTDKGP